MSDYRTLLGRHGEERWATTFLYDSAETILATRVPWLCGECDQGDVAHLPYSQTCSHPNAPTIADLLQWGEQYPKVRADLDHVVSCPEVWCDRCDQIESDTLAALRGEGQ